MIKLVYDLIVIGMGPAGISAAIYAKRAGLNILCLDKMMPGGYLNFIDRIDNYPGYYNISGPELAFKMQEQLSQMEVPFVIENVVDIKIENNVKLVVTSKNSYSCKNVIIATGRVSRQLGLENELELEGKGISHCALCDGALFKGRDVAVVGGGNSALQEAKYLANICNKVYIIHRRDSFRADVELVNEIQNQHNVEFVKNVTITKLLSDGDKLIGVELSNGLSLDIACLFSYVGYVPGTKFATTLNITDNDGYINVDKNYETNIPGIYAIGDIIKQRIYQIVTAVSDGAVCATIIADKLKSE
ncbi:MAG: FAD-dependent oxidoreductase [Bacilli bacterium]|nr:FAD-dependent oxidoreductase [Bacilli bacterium]